MISNDNIQNLLNALKDKNSFIRNQAVKSLEKIGDKSVIPVLIDVMLNDNAPHVRHAVAIAFQKQLADKSAVQSLIKKLKDPDLYVRGAAAAALGIIKDKTAVPYLCEALKDKEEHVRWAAIPPLGQIGDISAISALRKLLDNETELPNVKAVAIRTLKQLENKQK